MNNWLAVGVGIVVGLTFLVGGGELLVRGASRLAAAMKIPPLIIGLTVVAFGTSSPELAVSIQSAVSGSADLALGNVIGSNIFNVLFILGSSALIIPLVVSSRLIRWDVPLMVGASVVVYGLSWDGRIGRWDGGLLFITLVSYIVWCVRQSRSESAETTAEFEHEIPGVSTAGRSVLVPILSVLAGLALLGVGSHLLVSGSVYVATRLGVSELIIGLTIVATGTSLPEVVTSVMAALRGEREIAVGNVVGSNLFNILGVLGLASAVSPTGIVVPDAALQFDLPVMMATAFACLPIFFTGNLIARWEGALFLGYYVAYMTYLILAATHSSVARTFELIMLGYVIPLTAVTLLIGVVRGIRRNRQIRA